MKLTKTLIGAATFAMLAFPTTATAQTGADLIGYLNVSPDSFVTIVRNGVTYNAGPNAAILEGDTVNVQSGNAVVNYTGPAVQGSGCQQPISSGFKLAVGFSAFCENIGNFQPMTRADAVVQGAGSTGSLGSTAAAGGSLGTAASYTTILAALAGTAAAYGIYEVIDGGSENGLDITTSP